MMSGLINGGRLLTEYAIAEWINNLTSASYPGADGKALAATDHPRNAARAGTWSNLESAAALSLTSFTTARTNLRTRGSSDYGYVMPIMPKLLVVPPALEKMARDLKHAEKNPSNALNEPNTFRDDDWTVKVYDYFTSSTNWFLMGNIEDSNKGIVYAVTTQPSIASLEGKDLSTDVIWGQRLRARFVVSGFDGQGIQFNAGA